MSEGINGYNFLVLEFDGPGLTSAPTGLDLDSMLDRSDSDLSTNDARTIRKQLEGLENMYSEVSNVVMYTIYIYFKGDKYKQGYRIVLPGFETAGW